MPAPARFRNTDVVYNYLQNNYHTKDIVEHETFYHLGVREQNRFVDKRLRGCGLCGNAELETKIATGDANDSTAGYIERALSDASLASARSRARERCL